MVQVSAGLFAAAVQSLERGTRFELATTCLEGRGSAGLSYPRTRRRQMAARISSMPQVRAPGQLPSGQPDAPIPSSGPPAGLDRVAATRGGRRGPPAL